MTKPEIPNQKAFIESYGLDAKVVVGSGDMELGLGAALEMEALFCPADTIARQDPEKRARYLAAILNAGGSLKPEHLFLLENLE